MSQDPVFYQIKQSKDSAVIKRDAHLALYEKFNRRHNILGSTVVALSTLVGSAIFGSILKNNDLSKFTSGEKPVDWFVVVAGALSILNIILSGLQKFLSYADKADREKNAADGYEEVRVNASLVVNTFESEFLSTISVIRRNKAIFELNKVEAALQKIGAKSKPIPNWTLQKIRQRYYPQLDISGDKPWYVFWRSYKGRQGS